MKDATIPPFIAAPAAGVSPPPPPPPPRRSSALAALAATAGPLTLTPAAPAKASFDPTPQPSAPAHIVAPGVDPATAKRLETGPMAGCKTWVGPLPGNGGHQTAIVVPPGVDLTKPVKVITYFHGHNQSIARNILGNDPPSIRDAMLKMAKEQNAVIIIPEGTFPGSPVMVPSGGAKPVSLRRIQDEALGQLKQNWAGKDVSVASWIVAGHSGGGRPINEALADKTPGAEPHINEAYYFDATYGQPTYRPDVTYHLYSITSNTHSYAHSISGPNVHVQDVANCPGYHDGAVSVGFAGIGSTKDPYKK
jgi:hypothetical protein